MTAQLLPVKFLPEQHLMLQPAFRRSVVAGLAGWMAAANQRLLERWEAQAKRSEPIDVTSGVSELTLEISLRALLGRDVDQLSQLPGGNPFELVSDMPERNPGFASRLCALLSIHPEAALRMYRDFPPVGRRPSPA